MAIIDGRQVAETLDGIRGDHVKRYQFAARHCDAVHVIDAACGAGYGAAMLIDAGVECVEAVDVSPVAIGLGVCHWARPGIRWRVADLQDNLNFDLCGASISFETIEHLADPLPFLVNLKSAAPQLFASVPNQERLPFAKYRFPDHHRHYTPEEFKALLSEAGWHVDEWWHQKDNEPGILHEGSDGRTMIVIAS